MKPHPRIRKTVKWGGAAVLVLLVIVWAISGWTTLEWWGRGGTFISLGLGRLDIDYDPMRRGDASLFMHHPVEFPPRYWWSCEFPRYSRGWHLALPLWMPAVAVLIPTALAFRLDTLARRRARAGMCPKCNYNLAGLPVGAPCPECGKATTPTNTPT